MRIDGYKIEMAPMQGYADHCYRRLHSLIFGGVDCYYTPFIRIEKGEPRRQDIARLKEAMGDGTCTVPQIIFRNTEEFTILTAAIRALGFKRIDLNLGCPYPMQTSKGRGAAMTTDVETMREVSEIIKSNGDIAFSVKMRLGMKENNEWKELMPILNDTQLTHVTLHPRVARQMYTGEIDVAEFADFLRESKNPVMWNGDVKEPADIDRIIREFPGIKGVMAGRGLLARPSLATEWKAGEEWDAGKRLAKIMELHDSLFEEYCSTLCGPTQILQKIKPFWEYLEDTIGHKAHKSIRKATTLEGYRKVIAWRRRP